MTNEPPEEDKFEIVFRILGNEIFGMQLTSQSRTKNWAVFGLIVLVVLTLLFSELSPLIFALIDGVS